MGLQGRWLALRHSHLLGKEGATGHTEISANAVAMYGVAGEIARAPA